MDVLCAMRIILNEIKDVSIVGIEEADVVVAPELDAGVEAPLVLSPLLARVPGPQVATVEDRAQVLPVGGLV